MSRRRGSTNSLVVIYWRDIPAQVTAGDRDDGRRVLLPARFQAAIDRAAIVAGKTDTAGYVAEWRRIAEPLTEAADEAAQARAARLDADHPSDVLEGLVRTGGWAPDQAKPPTDGEEPLPR